MLNLERLSSLWQACSILALLLDSRHPCLAPRLPFHLSYSHLHVQYPLLKLMLLISWKWLTRQNQGATLSQVASSPRQAWGMHCQRGMSQLFIGDTVEDTQSSTAYREKRTSRETPSEAEHCRQSWEMGWSWRSSGGCLPSFNACFLIFLF